MTINVSELETMLLGRWGDLRLASRALMADPAFWRDQSLDGDAHRQRVFEQLGLLVERGDIRRPFPIEFGGHDDPGGNVAAFPEMFIADPSLQIKAGVQWGLFGSAVLHLGTSVHHERWLPGIMSLEIPGCFAMTETGHGSDVAELRTTATYIAETDEFEIHTPSRAAWKDYIGNAALHGTAAVVFAQLLTGGESQGVHAFYVPIRDDQGRFLPGVGGEDDGLKGGLRGIDNGRLHFTRVRIPRDHLLDRYGSVAPGGAYSSPIESMGRRFFTMVGTLVQGRVSLDGASVVASKAALAIAVRYASTRRQFDDGTGRGETLLLDYQLHQRRLVPRIAETYAMAFAHERLLARFHDVFSGADDSDAARQELEALAAGNKAFSTWAALDTLQEAREACGGAGFLAENRLTLLRQDLDIYATFEGDNHVLLQLVGKRLLGDFARSLRAPSAVFGVVAGQAGRSLGLAKRGAITGEGAQRRLLQGRARICVEQLGWRLRHARSLGPEEAAAAVAAEQNELVAAARAQAEYLEWDALAEAVHRVTDPATREVLGDLRDLFGLRLIERRLGWYLAEGLLTRRAARGVAETIDDVLLPRLRPHLLDLVDAFGYSPEHLRAPIGGAPGADAYGVARTASRRPEHPDYEPKEHVEAPSIEPATAS